VSWAVAPGEIHCLVGENGSGKSTLIKIVSGVYAPDPGSVVRIDAQARARLTPHLARRLGIEVIYQDLSLFPNLSVAENIAIDLVTGNPAARAPKRRMRARAAEILAGLEHRLPLDTKVGALPVAQRQVVAICRGLATDARLLFMDEPTASLTRHEVDRLFTLVRRLKALGVAVVFVSHRMDEIVEIAERVSVLRDGRMVGTWAASEVTDHGLAEKMTGHSISETVTARQVDQTAPVLELRGATRQGEFADINLTLHRGEILGLTGLLGAGRTELALALFGMTRLDAGEILLEGQRLELRSNADAIAAGIAYVSEDRLTLGLNLPQSIADNVALPVLDHIRDRAGFVPAARRRGLARDWVERLGIKAPDVTASVQTLSGGNQQRVVLAKWLATAPRVLILDSPTVGVDIRNKQGIYDIIRDLAEKGVAILLISDEISEVFFNADRVLHMRQGRIDGAFMPREHTIERVAEAVYG
jgi:simple sugar transport system ATP-binding protein